MAAGMCTISEGALITGAYGSPAAAMLPHMGTPLLAHVTDELRFP